MGNPNDGRSPAGFGERVTAGLLGGWIAFAGAGLIDGLVSWGPSAQFLPGFAERLGLLAYQAASSGLFGAVVGAAVATVLVTLGETQLGNLARALMAPSRRSALISLLVTGPPILYLTGTAAYRIVLDTLSTRRHVGLQLGTAMVIGVVALFIAILLIFVFAAPIERMLGILSRKSARFGRLLAADRALAAGAALALLGSVLAVVVATWDTLALLRLRGAWVVFGAVILYAPGIAAGRIYARALGRRHLAIRIAFPVLILAAHVGGVLATGSVPSVRQAAIAYTGLGGKLLERYRKLADLDRDGYSPILGGGDCDDFDPTAHPGGTEIPGDGIDQNCIGGDASLTRDV